MLKHRKPSLFQQLKNVKLIVGGKSRQQSTLNALKYLNSKRGTSKVLIHDAARPNINEKDIEVLYSDIIVNNTFCSYFYTPVYDSIKKVGKKDTDLKQTNKNKDFLFRFFLKVTIVKAYSN